MTKLFEAFEKYHNANYHDGDNTFDDEVYKKSNGEDFDNPFVQDCFDHFEAAWQKQQKVVDELKARMAEADKLMDAAASDGMECVEIWALYKALRGEQ